MAAPLVYPRTNPDVVRSRSTTSGSSSTSSSTQVYEEDPEDAIPTSSSAIEISRVLSHESSQFDVINTKASRALETRGLCYQVTDHGASFMQRLIKLENPCKGQGDGGNKKVILNDITLQTRSGQMLAILGSSGSGKTTLLDVIACQTSKGEIFGDVILDGAPRTPENLKSCAAYVRQDDRLLPHLTVKETLNFVAQLKLPSSWSDRQRKKRVNSVIAELGLRHVANSKVGGEELRGISGGERRRVSIGIQLLLDPSILFLDEPTSGLDSFTAHNLVETLAKMARNNRIVIMTIHQPRSDIFELFDQMLLLSQGQIVYFGLANQLVSYFTGLGYPCPEFTNPCDYYVDLATIDRKTEETEEETTVRVNRLIDLYRRRDNLTVDDQKGLGLLPPDYTPKDSVSNSSMGDQNVEWEDIDEKLKDPDKDDPDNEGSTDEEGVPRVKTVQFHQTKEMQGNDLNDDQASILTDVSKLDSRNPVTQKQSEASLASFVNQAFQSDVPVDAPTANWHMKSPDTPTIWSEQRKVFKDSSFVLGNEPQHKRQSFQEISERYPTSIEMNSEFQQTGPPRGLVEVQEKAGVMTQFWVLIRRTLRNNMEDYSFLIVQAIEALFMSIIIGVIYLKLGLDQTGARDRFGLLYVLAALYPYMVILDVIGKYYKERFILYYEMLDDLYSAGPYFFAKVLGDLPEHIVFTVFYTVPVYFLSGLQTDPALFFKVFAVLFIVVLCSRCLALWAGSLFSAYPISVIFAQSIFSMFLLSSGFIFNLENLFIGMQWVSYISYLKWGYQALCTTEFIGLNFTCNSLLSDACINDGEDALETYSLQGGAVWQSALVISAEVTFFLSMFFVAVRFKSQKPHQQ